MNHARLTVFARYPTPGRAKTRLIPAFGAAGAARLQDALTRHTLDEAAALAARRQIDVEVRFTGAPTAAMRERYGGACAYVEQGEGDLGARLVRATSDSLPGRPVVIVGTDCPGISADVLESAFDALAGADVVIGPATDGGYYLLGLRRFAPALFQGIAWSTAAVAAQTRRAAEQAGFSCSMLRPLTDVDTAGDLEACGQLHFRMPAPYRPDRVTMTGTTGALGQRFLAQLLQEFPEVQVTALVRFASLSSWSSNFRRLVELHGQRVTLIDADLETFHPSGNQRRSLTEADGGLWHFAASTALHAGSPAAEARIAAVNDGGTARLLQLLAGSDRPGPFYHLSTAYVCGRRTGTVYEHELDDAGGFRNGYERSKYAAEFRVRTAMAAGLYGLILRPSLVTCDDSAGSGADLLSVLTGGVRAAGRDGRRLTLRMPADARINAVAPEWLSRALLCLAPFWGARRTYHLTAAHDVTIADFAAMARRRSGVQIHLRPSCPRDKPSVHDRLTDRMLRPFRPYFDAEIQFDRRNLELDCPTLTTVPDLEVQRILDHRLAHGGERDG